MSAWPMRRTIPAGTWQGMRCLSVDGPDGPKGSILSFINTLPRPQNASVDVTQCAASQTQTLNVIKLMCMLHSMPFQSLAPSLHQNRHGKGLMGWTLRVMLQDQLHP